MSVAPRPVIERFMAFISPEPNTGCWLWAGADDQRYGYGRFGLTRSKAVAAHRLSWALHRGGDPGRLHVLHKCDVPACVNPDHLFLGTDDDNRRDAMAKGRTLRGERGPGASLSNEQAERIRLRAAAGESQAVLSREFGVEKWTIGRIVRRQTYVPHARKEWNHVA
jgi:hypothetical protein